MMYGIDSHCHLDCFENDLEEVVARAKSHGIAKMITIGTRIDDFQQRYAICKKFPKTVEMSIGIHPDHIPEVTENEIHAFFEFAKKDGIVAVGEIGLDYREDPEESIKRKQRDGFAYQMQLAEEYQLPVYIHARDCGDEALDMARQFSKVRGVFHCFTGDPSVAKKILDLGWYISISGIVTFNKAVAVQETAAYIPLDCMLIETDAPFLAPSPYRGKRNEPAYVRFVAEHIAQIRGISVDAVLQQTTENFFNLFTKAVRPDILG